jgi:pimeloyl-ACP methyl ester carboxylesterase
MTFNFKTFGEGSPLVIFHGLLGSLDNWVTVSKALAEKYKVYIIDLPNHGKSYHTQHFSYDSISNDLDSFFAQNGLNNFSVLGHSMGGKLALKYIDMFEGKIDNLIIVDIANKSYKSNRFSHIFEAIRSIPLSDIKSRSEADNLISDNIKNEGERSFVLKNLKRTSDGFMWSPNVNLLYNSLFDISSKIKLSKKVKKRTLFLLGEKSNYFNDTDKNNLKEEFENYSIKKIKNAGHWVHAENPKDFINSVDEFLSSGV